jgi:hypothetical protein
MSIDADFSPTQAAEQLADSGNAEQLLLTAVAHFPGDERPLPKLECKTSSQAK